MDENWDATLDAKSGVTNVSKHGSKENAKVDVKNGSKLNVPLDTK